MLNNFIFHYQNYLFQLIFPRIQGLIPYNEYIISLVSSVN